MATEPKYPKAVAVTIHLQGGAQPVRLVCHSTNIMLHRKCHIALQFRVVQPTTALGHPVLHLGEVPGFIAGPLEKGLGNPPIALVDYETVSVNTGRVLRRARFETGITWHTAESRPVGAPNE